MRIMQGQNHSNKRINKIFVIVLIKHFICKTVFKVGIFCFEVFFAITDKSHFVNKLLQRKRKI